MSSWIAVVIVVLGAIVPWALCLFPLTVRLVSLLALAGAGLCLWLPSVKHRSRPSAGLLLGSDLASVFVASGWISVASFSAQLSRAGTAVLYGAAISGIMLPALVSLALSRGREGRRPVEGLLLILPLVLSASVFLARPARRYRAMGREVVQPVAERLGSVREATAWVRDHIEYGHAPFIDAAGDTLGRGIGTCSGQANVLHKILLVNGLNSRIVHVEAKGRLHTLAEYFDDVLGKWILVDPGHGLDGRDHNNADGLTLMTAKLHHLPSKWRRFTRLYVYDPMNGYVRVDLDNRHLYYRREGP